MAAPLRTVRTTLLHTDAICAERVRCTLSRVPTAEVYEPRTQIVFPLGGAFFYHVGQARRLVDVNQVAFVRAGQTSADSHPIGADVSYLVLTPAPVVVGEHRLAQTASAGPALQVATARWVTAVGAGGAIEPLVAEEAAIRIVQMAVAGSAGVEQIRPCAAVRLTERAKARLASSGRPIGVTELAGQLAVSPAYLSDAFRRAEGIPLVRYQLRLRLIRALAELPHTDDLAQLALALGFSSHSHFTTAFRTTLGMTPSQYRRQVRINEIQKT